MHNSKSFRELLNSKVPMWNLLEQITIQESYYTRYECVQIVTSLLDKNK